MSKCLKYIPVIILVRFNVMCFSKFNIYLASFCILYSKNKKTSDSLMTEINARFT